MAPPAVRIDHSKPFPKSGIAWMSWSPDGALLASRNGTQTRGGAPADFLTEIAFVSQRTCRRQSTSGSWSRTSPQHQSFSPCSSSLLQSHVRAGGPPVQRTFRKEQLLDARSASSVARALSISGREVTTRRKTPKEYPFLSVSSKAHIARATSHQALIAYQPFASFARRFCSAHAQMVARWRQFAPGGRECGRLLLRHCS